MSNEFVKKIERRFYNNARKSFVIPDWKGVFFKRVFKNPSSQLFLYFFRKCSEQFLTCQDQTGSYILHGLAKSQLSTTAKIKVLKIVIDRGINVNQLDGTKRTVLDYLIENNDIECIEVLLKYSHCLQIPDIYLLLLRNTQKEVVCEILFKYADKHEIAPHLSHSCYYKIISILKSQCTKSDNMKENNLNKNYDITLKDDLNSLQDLIKNSSPHISSGPVKLPNHEAIDRVFEISTTDQEDVKRSIKRSEKKLTQKSLVKTAKTKKHLKTKEAVAYMHSMKQKRLKILQFEIKNTPASNDRCCKDDLSEYKVLGVGSYSIVYHALCNGQPRVAKARNPSITKANNEQILQEIEILKSLNHPNVVQFVGTYYHGNTPLLVMEEMWLNLSKWLKINPSASLKNKLCILIDVTNGLKYLHSQNMIHCDLIANNILLTTNLQAKIGDFGMTKVKGQNMIQVPSDFSHIPPEVCTPHSICTEKLDIFSFGCVMIHTITQEFPAVNKESCATDTEIKRRSEYLNKIKGISPIYSIILHCLQNNPSCRPSANKLHYLLNACVVLKSHYYSDELLKHKEIGQGSYSKSYVDKKFFPFIAKKSVKISVKVVSLEILNLTFLNKTHVIQILDGHHNERMTMENWWMNLSMQLRNNSSKFLTDKVRIIAEFINGLKYLHLKKICNHGLTADHVLLSIKLQTKICNLNRNDKKIFNVTDPANNCMHMSSSTCTCSLKKSAENFLCNLVNVQSVLQGFHELDTTEFYSRAFKINDWFECISLHLQTEPISRLSAYQLHILFLLISNKLSVQQQDLTRFHHRKSLNDTSPIMSINILTLCYCRFVYKYYQDKNSCSSQEVSLVNFTLYTRLSLCKQPSLKRKFLDLLQITFRIKVHQGKFTLQCITIILDFSKTEKDIVFSLDTDELQFSGNINPEDIQLILKIIAHNDTRKQKIVARCLRKLEIILLWIARKKSAGETTNGNIGFFSDFNDTLQIYLKDTFLNCIEIVNFLWKNILSCTNIGKYIKAAKILQLIDSSFNHIQFQLDIASVFVSQILNKNFMCYYLDDKKVGVIKIIKKVQLLIEGSQVFHFERFLKRKNKDNYLYNLQTASVLEIWCTDIKNISTDVLTKYCFIGLTNTGTDLKRKNKDNYLYNLQTASVLEIWCTDIKNISTDVLTKYCFIGLTNTGTDLILHEHIIQAPFCEVKLQEVLLHNSCLQEESITKTNSPLMLLCPSSNNIWNVAKNKLWDSTNLLTPDIPFADDLDILKSTSVVICLNTTKSQECNNNANVSSSLLSNKIDEKVANVLAFSNIKIQVFCLSLNIHINSPKSAEHHNAPISNLYDSSEETIKFTSEKTIKFTSEKTVSEKRIQFTTEFDLQASSTFNGIGVLHNYKMQLLEMYYLFQTQYRSFIDIKQQNPVSCRL